MSSGITNGVFNNDDGVVVVVDNSYSAATGGQYIPSSRADVSTRTARHTIQNALKGVGVKWVRTVRTYHLATMLKTLRQAMTSPVRGPKVIVAEGECQLNRQRRVRPLIAKTIDEGRRVVKERFGVDAETCTGDHSCVRLSGCPSLTIKPNSDPLRQDPVAYVDNSCVGCGVCGTVAHVALMPVPGEVDVVIASELMEAGRAVLRGLVDVERTAIVASSHREYAVTEKMALGDGIADSGRVLASVTAAARRSTIFDMAELSTSTDSVISSVLFGALAGAGCLPFTRQQYEDAIKQSGIAVDRSMAGFAAGYARAAGGTSESRHTIEAQPETLPGGRRATEIR